MSAFSSVSITTSSSLPIVSAFLNWSVTSTSSAPPALSSASALSNAAVTAGSFMSRGRITPIRLPFSASRSSALA